MIIPVFASSTIRRPPRGRRRWAGVRAGVSIAEVMAAIVVFTLGLMGSTGLMASSLRQQRLVATRIEMISVADAKVDELRVIGQTPLGNALRSQLAVGGSTTTSVTNYSDTIDNADGRAYVRRWQIAADVTGARRVTIRVQPVATGNYQWGRVEFTTLVAF